MHFIIDSTFNISKEYAEKYNIKIVSLKVTLNNKTFIEQENNTWEEFYSTLSTSKEFPKSCCPTPEDYEIEIKNILNQDENAQIFVLTFSSNLSGTYNSARIACENFDAKNVCLIDLQTYTTSSKLILEDAIENANNGKTFEEIKQIILDDINKVWVKFIPNNMKALKKGGRVSLLTSIIADTVNIKPVLEFKQGVFNCYKKTLGMGKAMLTMLSAIPKTFKKINFMYIFEKENITKLKTLVQKMFGHTEFEFVELGPVAGTHIGPNSIGIAVLEN